MIVDSSALLAVLLEEEESTAMTVAMFHASSVTMSAANWLETAMVFDGRSRQDPSAELDRVVRELGIRIVPFGAEQATLARDAHRRYAGRPARLNFGDGMAYALAKSTGKPPLYKGGDFAHTDITPALA